MLDRFAGSTEQERLSVEERHVGVEIVFGKYFMSYHVFAALVKVKESWFWTSLKNAVRLCLRVAANTGLAARVVAWAD